MNWRQIHQRVLPLVVAALTCGCAFSRLQINERNKLIDLDKVQVGQTTYMDVLREFGPPGPISVDRDAVNSISKHHLRYITIDARTSRFVFPVWVILPFVWNSTNATHDTLIEFDEEGKVTHATQIRWDNIWRPLSDIEDLPEPVIQMK
jgi:hypothetical protein